MLARLSIPTDGPMFMSQQQTKSMSYRNMVAMLSLFVLDKIDTLDFTRLGSVWARKSILALTERWEVAPYQKE